MIIIRQNAADEELIRRIEAAEREVAIYAPGVSVGVAEALVRAMRRLEGCVKVVLDVSVRTIELGYLPKDALRMLWAAQAGFGKVCLYHVEGLRLSTLHVDDSAIVYATISKKVEEVSGDCPNGIELSALGETADGSIDDLAQTPVTSEMISSLSVSLDEIDDRPFAARLEEAKAKAEELKSELLRAAEENEKLKGEIAQVGKKAVEEYKNRIKIEKVDFKARSVPEKIADRRIKLPSELLVGLDKSMGERLSASFRMFPNDKELEEALSGKEDSAWKRYQECDKEARKLLIPVRGYGNFLLKKDRVNFDEIVDRLKDVGEELGGEIRKLLRDRRRDEQQRLFQKLLPQWKNMQDPWWRSYVTESQPTENRLLEIFESLLDAGDEKSDGFMKSVEKIRPSVDAHYYQLDDSLLKDQKFRHALNVALRDKVRELKWQWMDADDLLEAKNNGERK